MDSSSKSAGDYNDVRYLPFYYHLGKQSSAKTVCQIGPKLGLVGACFLKSCETVDSWTIVDNKHNNCQITTSNLKLNSNFYKKTFCDFVFYSTLDEIKSFYDICFITESFEKTVCFNYMEFMWESLSSEGLLVVDYITSNNAFHEFCRVKNREPMIFNTRYGVGIVQK